MNSVLTKTDFHLPNQTAVYHGKVRDVYTIGNDTLVMIATDRISAFDVVLPEGIPYKGHILNQIAATFLDATADICPNWKRATPDPMATVGLRCQPFPIEMIVRGFLCGSAWRAYKDGERQLCGVSLPNGLHENQRLPNPIITPTTKAQQGNHDENISKDNILKQRLASPDDYERMERYALALFQRGSLIAGQRGLLLADTKYEFGKHNGDIFLIDEIHTPDSSRYFYADSYEQCLRNNLPQKQLSKEFVRQWLMDNNFQGKTGQRLPTMTPDIIRSISQRYIELFERITGQPFAPAPADNLQQRIESNLLRFLTQ